MLLTHLELYNFLAYRSPGPLDLTGIGLACLSGPNGAGKSSLLDAITWALWGKARARTDDELIHSGQTEMRVTVEFQQDGKRYRVERQRKLKGASGKLRLLAFSDEGLWNVLFDGMRDTQPQIINLLRLNYDTFVNSAYLQQGKADAFTTRTAKERRDILKEILGLEQWSIYEKRAREKLDAAEEEKRGHESAIRDKDAEIAREPVYQQELIEAEHKFLEAQAARAEAELAYERVRGATDRMSETTEKISQRYKAKRGLEAELAATTEELARKHNALEACLAAIAESESIEAGFAALQQARTSDADFHKRERRWHDLISKQEKAAHKLDREADKLNQEATALRKSIAKAELTASEWDSLQETIAVAEQRVAQLTERKAQRDAAQESLERMRFELTALKEKNSDLDEATAKLREKYLYIKDSHQAICPVCRQPLDEHHRQELLGDFEQEGLANNGAIAANNNRIQTVMAERKELESMVRNADGDLKKLETYQTELARSRARLELVARAAEEAGHERALLEALEQRIALGDFAHEVRSQLIQLTAEIDALGYDRDAHAETTAALGHLSEYEKRMHELRSAQERLPDLQKDVDSAAARLARLQNEVQTVALEIAEMESFRTALADDVQQETLRRGELNEARKQETAHSVRMGGAQQALNSVQQARARRKVLQDQLASMAHKAQIYRQLRDSFNQNGIPAMIIEAAIPELELQTNKYLSMISDGQMQVQFVTQKENKSGNVVEALDIRISDGLGTRDYSLYSGGESFRVNFAVRVALSQFLARRAGAQLRTLFIDEGFGSQDAFGRERLVEAINRIRTEFELILVVTHIDELRDAFQNHIRIVKAPTGSEIEILVT